MHDKLSAQSGTMWADTALCPEVVTNPMFVSLHKAYKNVQIELESPWQSEKLIN